MASLIRVSEDTSLGTIADADEGLQVRDWAPGSDEVPLHRRNSTCSKACTLRFKQSTTSDAGRTRGRGPKVPAVGPRAVRSQQLSHCTRSG